MGKRTLDRDAKAVVAAFEATALPDETDPAYRALAPLIAAIEQLKRAVAIEKEAASDRARAAQIRRMTPAERVELAAKHRRLAAELEPDDE